MSMIGPLTETDIRDIHGWEYPGELAMYSLGACDAAGVAFFLDPANGYFGIYGVGGELEGFCSFGHDARVSGGNYSTDAIDVGIGLRPDLTGRGLGTGYAQLVFAEARRRYPGLQLRVTVAAFNQRSIRVCENNGFQIRQGFQRPADGMEFVILTVE